MDTLSNPFTWFILITLLYTIAKQYLYTTSPSTILYLQIGYFLLMIIVMFVVNKNMMSINCGETDGSGKVVLTATLVPWMLMFLPMMLLLYVFPIWKQPFSNTIGYLITRLSVGSGPLLQLLQSKESPGHDALREVYESPFILINKFTPQNMIQTLITLKDTLNDKLKTGLVEPVQLEVFPELIPLQNLVHLKDSIGESIWYMLAGSLALTKSFQMITDAGCTRTIEQQNSSNPKPPEKEETIPYAL